MGKLFANGHRYDHFDPEEFWCPCCGEERMQHSTMEKAETLRHRYGKRLNIPEGGGYRCPNYPHGAKLSAHREGHGIDWLYPREDHFLLMSLAFEVGFTGIFDKNKKGKYQMHCDDAPQVLPERPRPWKGTY